MFKSLKKASIFILMLTVFVGVFASQGLVAAEKPVSFTVFFHYTPQEARGVAFRELVEQYNNENPDVNVKLSYFADWPALQQKIRTMVGSGNPPDAFYFNYNPNDRSLFKSGNLLDFNQYVSEKGKENFFKEDLKDLTYKGKLLAIPFEKGAVPFLYNKELLEKAGVESIPQTWDEFFAACKALKNAGITPVSLYTSDDAWHSTNFFSYFAAGLGGKDVFEKSLTSSEIVKSAKLLKKLFQYTTPGAIGGKWAVSIQNFLTGRTAILVDGPWVIGMIKEQMKSENVVVASAPTFSEDDSGLMVMDAITPWSLSNKMTAKEKEAAVDFIKYLTSEKAAKKLVIEGKMNLAVKMDLTEKEKEKAGRLLSSYIELTNSANQRILQITRQLKPAAMSELQSLLESLVMDQISAEKFANRLEELNQ